MEKDDQVIHTFLTHISQHCFDKAKEYLERERETCGASQFSHWTTLLIHLQQIILVEKSYMDIGFLQNKNKGFLRKDNPLCSVYESLRNDVKRIEDNNRVNPHDKNIVNYCQNLGQFYAARINLIHFYDNIFLLGSGKTLKYMELLAKIDSLIEKHSLGFTDISLTPIKAIFSMECEILQQLFKALINIQKLHFLPSLSHIYGAQTRLSAWESKIQNRETWKLGFLKNNQLPMLFQWLLRFKGSVLSKFSLYFHDILAQQTTSSDMKQLCSKLHYDYYHKMSNFQRKYDATCVMLLSGLHPNCELMDSEKFPVIVSCPQKEKTDAEIIKKMITETASDLAIADKIIYKYSSQDQTTHVLSAVEANIYLVMIFQSKKSEKDVYISNFIGEMCLNLRCTKIFVGLKNPSK